MTTKTDRALIKDLTGAIGPDPASKSLESMLGKLRNPRVTQLATRRIAKFVTIMSEIVSSDMSSNFKKHIMQLVRADNTESWAKSCVTCSVPKDVRTHTNTIMASRYRAALRSLE